MQGAVRLNQLPSAEVRAAMLAGLARYTGVLPDALTGWQARRDPCRRGWLRACTHIR
jgi:hypothetical protein